MLKKELTFFGLELYGLIEKDLPSRRKALVSIRAHTYTPKLIFVPTFLIPNGYKHT